MMQTATQANNIPLAFEKIQNEPQMELNSQGERVEVKSEPQQQSQQPQEQSQSGPWWEDTISLAETPLGSTMNDLMPATDDTGMEHKIISWGHVLKSTHDLARWSEKTGALRVNTQESFDSINDSVVLQGIDTPLKSNTNNNNNNSNTNNNNNNNGKAKNGNGNGKSRSVGGRQWVQKGGKSEIIKTWPVLKSTHDQATLAEKRGGQINPAGSLEALDDLAGSGVKQQGGGRQQRGGGNNRGRQQQRGNNNKGESGGRNEGSEILQSWPVLKSTHDAATRGEKNGSINSAEAGGLDLASNGNGLKLGGGSLQSGLDTQGGSHMQLDSEKIKETPESAMQALNVHV